ncbi:MAG: hypothetical protein K2R93_12465 [Gemmatimonadaceae bacterium]|nr:hypothetical protein [Gemmatimonadaceae bacterium]
MLYRSPFTANGPSVITPSKVGLNVPWLLDSAIHGIIARRTFQNSSGQAAYSALQQFGRFKRIAPTTGVNAQALQNQSRIAWRAFFSDGNNSNLLYTFPDHSFVPWFPSAYNATIIVEHFKRDTDFILSTNPGSAFGTVESFANRCSAHVPEGNWVDWDMGDLTQRVQFNWAANQTLYPTMRWHTFGFLSRGFHRSIWIDGTKVAELTATYSNSVGNCTNWAWAGHTSYGAPYNSGGNNDYGFCGFWNYAFTDAQMAIATRDIQQLRNGGTDVSVMVPSRRLVPKFDLSVSGWAAV